ncbi:hypothetical protein CDAR_454961 [Caerostris darwini]|uniref:Secreted protein n=1 Tax=Caerostris darwini TaxID=1538125 RepID=A0AAV4P119_9ARAC|nr:hypothetical protein CDAR_454961 [Caerostris darwini]
MPFAIHVVMCVAQSCRCVESTTQIWNLYLEVSDFLQYRRAVMASNSAAWTHKELGKDSKLRCLAMIFKENERPERGNGNLLITFKYFFSVMTKSFW